ncbi:MAG: tryptophan 2,3-dioxygenase [Bacteroidota bacterium]
MNYHDYLQLDTILNAQDPASTKAGKPAHDESLFIVIHQAYELWFKQLHTEVDSALELMKNPSLNDNSPELQTLVHRLDRCATILQVLVHQIDIMETMTAQDFLEFRDLLRPASGFQSWQFKELEAKLGLKFEHRHGHEYYLSQLRPEQVALIRKAESSQSLLQLVNDWLERMPFLDKEAAEFWPAYRSAFLNSLSPEERTASEAFEGVFSTESAGRSLSPRACRAALFIMLHRGYPLLHLPFRLLNALLEIDNQLSLWRYRHMNMVQRIIGIRMGTGGSTGRDYLKGAADKHYIFREIAELTSFLMAPGNMPILSESAQRLLGFQFAK